MAILMRTCSKGINYEKKLVCLCAITGSIKRIQDKVRNVWPNSVLFSYQVDAFWGEVDTCFKCLSHHTHFGFYYVDLRKEIANPVEERNEATQIKPVLAAFLKFFFCVAICVTLKHSSIQGFNAQFDSCVLCYNFNLHHKNCLFI